MPDAKEAAEKFLIDNMRYDSKTGELRWRDESEKCTRAVHEKCHDGYLRVNICMDGVMHRFMAHRLAWLIHYGQRPEGEIDHINGQRSDNRIDNLRDVSRSGNCQNAAMRADNTSGVSGVYWDNSLRCWRASVRHGGRRHYVGVFHDIAIAKQAITEFRKRLGFSERHGSRKR